MQLDLLWQYMQVDMDAERFEQEMRNSPNRQQLIKQRNFLRDQQANMARIEDDVAGMLDRLEAVRDETTRLQDLLDAAFQADGALGDHGGGNLRTGLGLKSHLAEKFLCLDSYLVEYILLVYFEIRSLLCQKLSCEHHVLKCRVLREKIK